MDTQEKTDQHNDERESESTGHDVNAVNEVDTSPERIERELNQAAIDEGLAPGATEDGAGFELHEQDETHQRDQAVPRVAALLGYAFGTGFVLLAPAWQVTADEIGKLATVWSRVVAKYLPFSWLRYLPDVGGGDGSACIECDAVAVTFQVLGPRIGKPSQENSEDGLEHAATVQPEKTRNNPAPQPDAMPDVHGQI